MENSDSKDDVIRWKDMDGKPISLPPLTDEEARQNLMEYKLRKDIVKSFLLRHIKNRRRKN